MKWIKWTPAVKFEKCYLSVYRNKTGIVYMTREAYDLLGRPKRVAAFPMGKTVALSPARKYGVEVKFNTSGQPFIVHFEAAEAIGPDNKAVYSYDEESSDVLRGSGTRQYFYFRVNSSAPAAPRTRPKSPAKR